MSSDEPQSILTHLEELRWRVIKSAIAIVVVVLGHWLAASIWLQPAPREYFKFNGRAIMLGLLSAAVLYLIFWTGKAVSAVILPFAGHQIGGIYDKGTKE